jgi:putative ABC transport system substrate-binding protein
MRREAEGVSQMRNPSLTKRKILIWSMAIVVLAIVQSVQAQQSGKIARVGLLFIGGTDQPYLESFKQGMRDLGYVEGKNVVFLYRYAEGNEARLGALTAELVRDKVDVIVATASNTATAAREVTSTIPIVVTSGNLLETGLAKDLAKPGGNVTGLTLMAYDLTGKRLEILKESVPQMKSVAALWTTAGTTAVPGYKAAEDAAKALSLRLHSVPVQSARDFDSAFDEMAKARDDGLLLILSPLTTLNSKRIVALALKHRLPGMFPTKQFTEEGGLMSYGTSTGDLYRRAATYVDKILKGAKPAELPVEQPMKFEFIVNLKTAKQIGLTIPPNVLVRADRVIR